jgi:hypothetical protein
MNMYGEFEVIGRSGLTLLQVTGTEELTEVIKPVIQHGQCSG